MTVLNNIKDFLTIALPDATIYNNNPSSPNNLNVLYTADYTVNYQLSETSLPPNNTSIGTFILGNDNGSIGNFVRHGDNYGGANAPPLITTFYQNNKLLYIGITTDYKVRFKNHANNQSWWNKVSRHWIKKYPSRTSALRAEKRIIARQKPKYNVTYNSQV
jgi:predicted GIY-YIG superfamily endonuclease